MAKTSRKGGRSDSTVVLSSAQNDRRGIFHRLSFVVPVYKDTMTKGPHLLSSAKDAEDKVLHQSREVRPLFPCVSQ